MIPFGKNYDAWQIPALNQKKFLGLTPVNQARYLISLAHLAPSSHNTQPWKFSINSSGREIGIYLNKKLILPASDPTSRQAVISIGCAIENLILAAEYYGLENKFVGAPDQSLPIFIRLQSKKNLSGDKRVIKIILNRKINRSEFDPERPLPAKILKEIAEDDTTTHLISITDKLRRLALAEFQIQADNYVLNSRRFAAELGEWLLPNNSLSGLGMPGATFGLRDAEAIRIHEGLLGKKHLEPEDALRFALGGKIGLEKSPYIGVITTPDDTPTSWLAAGRRFENIFLKLTAANISVAVHAGVVEVPLINKMFAAAFGTLKKIQVLFRAGYPKRKEDERRPHSPRLPLDEILI